MTVFEIAVNPSTSECGTSVLLPSGILVPMVLMVLRRRGLEGVSRWEYYGWERRQLYVARPS